MSRSMEFASRPLCDESEELGNGLSFEEWPWRDWRTVRLELSDYLQESADFFRTMQIRKHFMWLMRWFGTGPQMNIWHTSCRCPLGIITLRLFVVLISNDADRCITLRDNHIGSEIIEMPFVRVVESGWPIFNILGRLALESKRISFPLWNACDDGDTWDGTIFRQHACESVEQEKVLPIVDALKYLHASHSKCSFGLAVSHFALAAAERWGRVGNNSVPSISKEHLAEGQRLIQEYIPSRGSFFSLITTKWPVWQVLERVARPALEGSKTLERHVSDVDILFCGKGRSAMTDTISRFAAAQGWRSHILKARANACPEFYRSVSRSLKDTAMLVLLSPLVWAWDRNSEQTLSTAIRTVSDDHDIDVVGFPSLDSEGFWSMNIWQIKNHSGELSYVAYPTGYPHSRGDRCLMGESSSATRVFRSAGVWKQLLAGTSASDDYDSLSDDGDHGLSFLVDLDIQTINAHLKVFTCMTAPIYEDAYLEKVYLTPAVSEKYRIESAHFSMRNHQLRCHTSEQWKSIISSQGTPSLRCLEDELQIVLSLLQKRLSPISSNQSLMIKPSSQNALFLSSRGQHAFSWDLNGSLQPIRTCVCCFQETSVMTRCWLELNLPWDDLPHAYKVQRKPFDETMYIISTRTGLEILRVDLCERTFANATPYLLPFPKSARQHYEQATLALSPNSAESTASAQTLSYQSHVEMLLCCLDETLIAQAKKFSESLGWNLLSSLKPLSLCGAFFAEAALRLQNESTVLLLSPFLWEWNELVEQGLHEGLDMLHMRDDISILGFATLSRDLVWQWNPRSVRHQYWKLQYSLPKDISTRISSSSSSGAPCALSDASSGSRIFKRAANFKALLQNVGSDVDNVGTWFVDLDLATHGSTFKSVTCAIGPMHEDDYWQDADLSQYLGAKYQIEVAQFGEKRLEKCLPDANWFQVLRKGLVAPWCFRRDVTKAFRDVHAWWTSLDPVNNFVVPEEGTFLALFRNGENGIMPWDSDFDVKLYTQEDTTVGEFMNHTKGKSFAKLEMEAYAYDGCGQDDYVLLRRPNITHHIGDVYVRGNQDLQDHPWRARLLGKEVRLSQEHLEHIFFTRYRTPIHKLFGDGIVLQCFLLGHNACLPDCRDIEQPCEFEDDFVHVENLW